ncbi:MAG: nicotinamide mononucleotide transporter [Actinomycetota bacterium]|jgi:nicotinamide mononucleotide transporter|nr:nicotinamide mononucleotide transporter [Actinomycetota bacterium]
MSVIHWLYNAQWDISGHKIFYREIIGNGFGLASAIGGMRRRLWAWPVGIVGNVLLFTVFLGSWLSESQQAPLLGQAGRQIFFILTSVYGWHRWSRTRAAGGSAPAVVPRWATSRERSAYLILVLPAVGVCYLVFRGIGAGFPVQWWYFLADSWIFVGSILATYAMARGWTDFWLCWIAVDLVGVPELLHFHYYPSAVLYAVYAGFVIWGFFVWRRAGRVESRAVGGLTPLQEATG